MYKDPKEIFNCIEDQTKAFALKNFLEGKTLNFIENDVMGVAIVPSNDDNHHIVFYVRGKEPVYADVYKETLRDEWNLTEEDWTIIPLKARAYLEAMYHFNHAVRPNFYRNWIKTYGLGEGIDKVENV